MQSEQHRSVADHRWSEAQLLLVSCQVSQVSDALSIVMQTEGKGEQMESAMKKKTF